MTDDKTNKMNQLSVKKQCKQTAENTQQTDLTMGILKTAVDKYSQSTVRCITILSNTDKRVRGTKSQGQRFHSQDVEIFVFA